MIKFDIESENYADYMAGSKFGSLLDVKAIPGDSYKARRMEPLPTHLRIMYRHVDWTDFVVKLDEQTIEYLQRKRFYSENFKALLDALEPGMNVILVDRDTMTPVTYSQVLDNSCRVEVLTLDEAIHKAGFWFAQNFTDGYGGFALTTTYFIAAFRLAMMEGDMSDEDRFSDSRYNKVWREMYTLLLHEAGKQLIEQTTETKNSCSYWGFELDQEELNNYLKCIND